MAKRKLQVKKATDPGNIVGLKAEVVEQPISETLEKNYMPYAMSVIVSRAIPEIDGFKPSHRKLLYTMYKMGLLNGQRTKSANIVGQTMRLNPHGDAAIYDTMVRLSSGYEALLTPFVDSKGNFGKVYSRDMACAASRYTEAKLSPICAELFGDVESDTVDFVDNYDGSMKEPVLLPTTFPNVLVSANMGIAVGMASQICGFNLNELCDTVIEMLQNPEHDLFSTLPAPDFPTGGEIVFDRSEMESIYASGRGSFKVRSKWKYLPEERIIEVYEIPYTATTEQIIDKISDLNKQGRIKEINDIRDETDKDGLKLAIEIKKGINPDKLMQKLFRLTPLEDAFPCNFNILVGGTPRVMGVKEILSEWIAWRMECIRRRTANILGKKKDKLHLLKGLGKILLDIDRAIRIIRETETESEVVPNLMIGFGIDEIQAEYIAEIKLRNINREYILKRLEDIEKLEKEIAELESILGSRTKIKNIVIAELRNINKKFITPRKTSVIYNSEIEEVVEEDIPDYPVTVFLSRDGYFKKLTPLALRMSGEMRYKDGDELNTSFDCTNRSELIFLTDRQQAYKVRASDLPETKAASLGLFMQSELKMDEGESVITMINPEDYRGDIIAVFENGKVARFELATYLTKQNRKKLINAYSDKSPVVALFVIKEESDVLLKTNDNRALLFNTSLLQSKTTRTTQGVAVFNCKGKRKVISAAVYAGDEAADGSRYRVKRIPSSGSSINKEVHEELQLSLLE